MKRRGVGKRPSKQKGVALITAVLMVALATVLAVEIGFKGYLSQRRAMTVFALDQGYQVALGAEALAADILMAADGKRTDLAQAWAAPITGLPIEVGGEGGGEVGEISGQLEDLTGRFNINLLAEPANPGDPAQVELQRAYLAQFKRMLEMAQLEPHWAEKIADWVDADIQPTFPEGAEDSAYTSLTPPYHTANRRITRVSELLALPEFGLERFRKLEPLIAALPADTKINVCTAPGIVLDSFSAAQRQYSLDAVWLAKQRGNGCFPDKKVLESVLVGPEKDHLAQSTDETSNYFRATIRVAIGSTEFTLYSLLKRDGAGVRPITRSFGTL